MAAPVDGIAGAVGVAAGGGEACAVFAAGTIKCWGDDESGQLGDGVDHTIPGTDASFSTEPVEVSGISDARAVAVGDGHACALLAGGSVERWGRNVNGELGDGTSSNRSTPVQVSGISDATAITAGTFHTCALRAGGAVACWGDNESGELGDGTSIDRSTPVQVSGISNATAVTAGNHTCALIAGGAVDCWGDNEAGELGDGTYRARSTPARSEESPMPQRSSRA